MYAYVNDVPVLSKTVWACVHTAIPITIEGHETAFNGFQHQFTIGKPLKNLKPTLNYYGNGSMRMQMMPQFCRRRCVDMYACVNSGISDTPVLSKRVCRHVCVT